MNSSIFANFLVSTPKHDFRSILNEWNLGQYIDIFEDEGYDDTKLWGELIKDNGALLVEDLGFKKGHKTKFISEYKKKFGDIDDMKVDENKRLKLNDPMGTIFVNPKTRKKEKGFYIIPSVKATSNKNSQYYWNFLKNHKFKSGRGHKVILVVGQTGAGKSTLLNSMINYIYGIKFEDGFRYKLIVEPPKKGGQAVSQTENVTSYELPDKNSILGYKLTVVDTPGFGDTRGVDNDILIMKDIKLWFETKLDTLDAVCFVVKSTDARLTPNQKYIFSSMLNLFGKDIKKNIFILVTFADTSTPPCLAALKQEGIGYKNYYKLNNSIFFKDPLKVLKPQEIHFDRFSWTMGIDCFKLFFDDLKKTRPTSLTMTRKVLQEREIISIKIEILLKKLDVALHAVSEENRLKKWVKAHEAQLNANAPITYQKKQKEWLSIKKGNNLVTTCTTCPNQTCHSSCCVSNKSECWAMTDGKCRICGCPDWSHQNRDYVWEEGWKTVEYSNWDESPTMKKRYEEATQQKTRAQRILDRCSKNIKKAEFHVTRCIIVIKGSINELSKIALNSNIFTAKDYFDKLIDTERLNKIDGWETRIESLKRLSKEAAVTAKIQRNQFHFKDVIKTHYL